MAHTIEDKIIELADKYTLNHSNENYLNNKAMLEEFRAYLEQEIRETDARKACDAYCKVCGHYAHTTPTHICRRDCIYYSDFVKILKGNKGE